MVERWLPTFLRVRNLILVHGFWHGSWCWNAVSAELASRGVPSVAVDMAGHGLHGASPAARWSRPFDPVAFASEPSPVAHVTASSAGRHLVEQIRRIGGGEPCVVVAHSMGGVAATAAAEFAPELFAHLVYVAAFTPVMGVPVVEYLRSAEAEGDLVARLLVADPAVIGALRIDVGDRYRHAEIREAFYNDLDSTAADAAIALLTPDAPAAVVAESPTVSADRYGAVPRTYVVCGKDNTIPVALQRRFVREIDAVSARPTRVVEMDASHSPFLSRPAELADAVAVAAVAERAGQPPAPTG